MTTQNPPSPNDPLSKGAKIADIKVLSDKAYHVSKCHDHINLCNADLEPLNESSTAFLFVSLSVLKMSFMIEVVVYLTVITDKSLEHGYCFK